MAVADFKPTLGMIELSTSGSILTGNNAAFCAKFLDKGVGGAPVSLESLTYVLPGQNREGEEQRNQPSVVVNLLMQLRASCDQNNFFLRTGQAAQAQVTARLHQVLSQCSGAARAQAGEIERAIRTRLVQEEEFSRALRKLERELKKNNVSLSQPLPEKETGRWSGSPFRQEKGRTARPEGPRNFLRIQMHRSELLWSIGMRQEERAPRRTGSHPGGFLKTEERIFSEADRPGEEGRGEQLAYLQKESGAFVPEPLQKQEKELSWPSGKRRKGGKSPEKRRESQTVQVPETERITLAARPSENYRENRTDQVPESMPLEVRLLPQPVRAERYIYPDSVYRIPSIPDENVRWTWRQVPRRAYAPVNWQMLRSVAPARIVSARKDGTVQFVPVFRREQLSGETGRTIFSVRELWTHSNNISILGRERPVQEYIAEEYKTEQYTVQNGPSPEVRLLPQPVRAERYIYRDNVYRSLEVPDSSVHGSRRQILEGNDPEIYRQLLKRSGPGIHRQTLGQSAGGPLRREFLPSVTKSSFQQAFPQYVQENFPSEPPQSDLRSLWFKLPWVSQKIWRQTTLRRYGPVNWKIFQNIPAARFVPAGKDGVVQFLPLLRREQLPGKTGRTAFSARETRTHSNNISILDRERPVQEYIAEEYKTEQYTVQNGPSPEARLLSRLVRAERYIYRDNVYRPSEVPSSSVRGSRRQILERNGPEIYRQLLKRSGSEIHRRTLGQTAGGLLRREFLPSVTNSSFQQAFPQYVQENFPSEPPQSDLRSLWFKLPQVSQKNWRQTTLRRYDPVNWKIFQSIPAARIVPAGKDGAVQFVPALRREQLPGETGGITVSVREIRTHFNNISILGRERPVQEHIAEEYAAEKYTVQNGQSPEVQMLSQPVRAEQYIYRDNIYRPPKVPGGSMDSVRKQMLQRAYAPVDRQMFRSVFPARTVPAGEDGTVRFIPVLRREQLPGETGRTIFSVREARTHFNNISILGRERPVREHIAEEYTTEQYTVQNGLSPEARLLSRPVRAERYIYRDNVYRPPEVPGWRAGRLRQPKLEQNIPGLYRHGPVRGEGAKLILRRVVDWAKELVQGPVERTVPGRNISSGTRPEPPFSGGTELRYARSAEKRREQEPAILTRPGERAGTHRVPLWRMLRSVERRTSPELWKTEDFLRETWTRNHILYRALRQKNEAKAEGPKTPLYTERENEREAFRRNSVSEPQSPSLSPRLIHFAQLLEAAEGTIPELPACRASEGRPSAGAPGRTEGSQAIVYRSHARPVSPAQPQAASPAIPGQLEGEDVFRAQTVSDGQVRAMEQAFSYQAPGNRREESERSGFESAYAPRAEEPINYNRLTEEILVRLERRLRAERRKFGL